jgi:Protein of unknown function (DUF3558)
VRFWLVGLFGLLCAMGIACGDDDDASSAGGSSSVVPAETPGGSSGGVTLQDACTLLSDEEVKAALGDDEIASSRSDPPTQANSTCQWEGSKTGNRYVNLTLRTVQNAFSVFESNYSKVEGAVAIDGVGDEAFALPGMDTPNNYRFITAAAVTSSLYIQVNIAGPNRSDEEALQVLTDALQQVLSKLE